MKAKNCVVLHGRPGEDEYYDLNQPSASNAHWLAWLQNSLLVNDIHCSTPEVPFAFEPQYELWRKEFERYEINEDTILVGHSTGAGFIVRWLTQNKVAVHKVILVGPYVDPFHEIKEDFFDFEYDRKLVQQTKCGITIFHSDDDQESVQVSTKKLLEEIDNIKYVEFKNYGHFCFEDSGSQEFPELLEECLKD